MAKNNNIEVEGKVLEVLKGGEYLIELKTNNENADKKHLVTAHVSGKMRMNTIRILQGDTVLVVLSEYDLTRGIIKWNKR